MKDKMLKFVTIELDGRQRISGKTYEDYTDMSNITIKEYNYDPELFEDFLEENEANLSEFSETYGRMPDVIDEIIIATDCGDTLNEYYSAGVFYKALIRIGEKAYAIDVIGKFDVRSLAEEVISSFKINSSLEYEYKDE